MTYSVWYTCRTVFFFRNGNYFKLDLYHNKNKDIASLLTPHEIKIQMERIVKEADRKSWRQMNSHSKWQSNPGPYGGPVHICYAVLT